jgi:hypothetical protein
VGDEGEVGADGNEATMRGLGHATPTGCGGRVVVKAPDRLDGGRKIHGPFVTIALDYGVGPVNGR